MSNRWWISLVVVGVSALALAVEPAAEPQPAAAPRPAAAAGAVKPEPKAEVKAEVKADAKAETPAEPKADTKSDGSDKQPKVLAPPKTDNRSAERSDTPPTMTEPVKPTQSATEAVERVKPPWDRPRFAPPTSPAPRVGYAPQQASPLPGYPGITTNSTAAVGYPGRTVGAGPLSSLFTDLKACQPGDVLTVVITQQATAQASGNKADKRDAKATLDPSTGLLKFMPTLGMSYSGSATGASSNQNSFSVATTFSARVSKVMENGNLMIEGDQKVNMDDKDQVVHITGEVRPYDVSTSNTVDSSRVANVSIKFQGIRDNSRPKSFIGKIFGFFEGLFGGLF